MIGETFLMQLHVRNNDVKSTVKFVEPPVTLLKDFPRASWGMPRRKCKGDWPFTFIGKHIGNS